MELYGGFVLWFNPAQGFEPCEDGELLVFIGVLEVFWFWIDCDFVENYGNLGTLNVNLGTLNANLGTLNVNLATLNVNLGTLNLNLGTLNVNLATSLIRPIIFPPHPLSSSLLLLSSCFFPL